jgi:hypothetical protein
MSIGNCNVGGTQWSYPVPRGPAQEAAPLILCGVVLLPQHWHCHKATRAETDLSILGIPPRFGSGGSNGVEAALCGVHGGKFGKR